VFDIGFWELLLIAIVALLVVGPERLPKLVREVGLWIGHAKASLQSIRREISRELDEQELREVLKEQVEFNESNQSIKTPTSPQSSTTNTKEKEHNG
jgi:sec-independent protein translocase protein TatB